MKIGDFDVEVTSCRVGNGWQSTGILPNGKKVTSAPKSSQADAEHDVRQQAMASLCTQRKYDVNRPFESMDDDDDFEADLVKEMRPPTSITFVRDVDALVQGGEDFEITESMSSRKFKHLSPADEAIVMHKADGLLEAVPGTYEIGLDGEEVHRPECPHCGGPGDAIDVDTYVCMNCNSKFNTHPGPGHEGAVPSKASFYPGGGASGGAGVSGFGM